jgi:hypothetical protein
MKVRQFIGSDLAASALAHLSILGLLILSTEVHPYQSVTPDSIAVDLVAPQDIKPPDPAKPPEPKLDLTPLPVFDTSPSTKAAAAPSPPPPPPPSPAAAPASPPAAASPQPPPPPPPSQPAARAPQREAARPPPKAADAPGPPPSQPAAPAYTPPEPDLTVRYHVMLGLPAGLPPAPVQSGEKQPGDGIDATASTAADLASSVVAEFRRHLRACLKLPASIAPSDRVMIKLRVLMTTDGRLAAEPILLEASASAKGPFLMQSAISGLQACQPFNMLPADRYGEWKVLDLPFTPRDFAG